MPQTPQREQAIQDGADKVLGAAEALARELELNTEECLEFYSTLAMVFDSRTNDLSREIHKKNVGA